jgi:murein DD-endopeptidase MepM/ murein hydrolase activator NlpD
VRDPRLSLRALALVALLGCETEQPASDPAASPSTPSPAPAPPQRAALPAPAIAAWADWPVEDVDPRAWFGWRIAPTGTFERVPGLVLHVDADALVLAIAEGTVESVVLHDDGTTELVVRHGDVEARYRPLRRPLVIPTMHVGRGTALGVARGPELELLTTRGGVPLNPLELLHAPLPTTAP